MDFKEYQEKVEELIPPETVLPPDPRGLANIAERLGHKLRYIADMCNTYGISFEQIMDIDIAILEGRIEGE